MDKDNKKNEDAQKVEGLITELDKHKTQIEDYTNSLKRLQAEFENYTKRVDKEKIELSLYASYKVLSKMLPVMDNFDKALENIKPICNEEQFKGLEMIYKQLHKLLEEEGVKPIECIGNKLDPFKHDVIEIVKGDEDNVVINEVQKGYAMKEKILRPSKVVIIQKKEEQ